MPKGTFSNDRDIYINESFSIKPFKPRSQDFLDSTTALYGPTKSGKSVATRYIMKLLRDHIDVAYVFCPNSAVYMNYIDPLMLHKQLVHSNMSKADKEANYDIIELKQIVELQEYKGKLYALAHNKKSLRPIYNLRPNERIDKVIRALESKYKSNLRELAHDYGKDSEKYISMCESFREDTDKNIVDLYRYHIKEHRRSFLKLTPKNSDERQIVKYLNINPKFLIIIDDCASQLKSIEKRDLFKRMFYQNRHLHVTMIICCQDDTNLPADIRKNSFNSIFTKKEVSNSNFTRSSNNFSKSTRQLANLVNEELYNEKYRMLVYIRDDPIDQVFYHYKFPIVSRFKFGSDALCDLCDELRMDTSSIDKQNMFHTKFK